MAGLSKRTVIFASFIFIFCALSARSSRAQKLTSDEVIARHLESIGSAKARAAIATRIISGTSQVIFRTTPAGQAIGKAVLASEEMKNLFDGVYSFAELEELFERRQAEEKRERQKGRD